MNKLKFVEDSDIPARTTEEELNSIKINEVYFSNVLSSRVPTAKQDKEVRMNLLNIVYNQFPAWYQLVIAIDAAQKLSNLEHQARAKAMTIECNAVFQGVVSELAEEHLLLTLMGLESYKKRIEEIDAIMLEKYRLHCDDPRRGGWILLTD